MTFANDPGSIQILGAGPTGLGAAYRLQELGFDDFTVLEAEAHPGGLASSYRDDHGFTWDVGGHVQFSHYAYYDHVLDRVLAGGWLWHDRQAWIRIKDRFIPYPFQNNIHRLDTGDRCEALRGLEEAAVARWARPAPGNFAEWIAATFGDGVARLFMYPYNEKVWGYPLDRLGAAWVGERVAIPDVDSIRRNILEGRDDVGWGPNNRFRFPSTGGTGAIWHGVAGTIRPERLAFGHRVTGVDLPARSARLGDGRRLRYGTLISSIPLDVMTAMCDGLPTEARRAADTLLHSSVHILGIGLKGGRPALPRTVMALPFWASQAPDTLSASDSRRRWMGGLGCISLSRYTTKVRWRGISAAQRKQVRTFCPNQLVFRVHNEKEAE